MRSIIRNLAVLAGAFALAGCVLAGAEAGKAKGPNPITGGEIEVTSLEAPAGKKPEKVASKPGEAKAAPAAAVAAPEAGKPPAPATGAPAAEKPATGPKPRPDAATAKEEIAPPEAVPPVPEELKTAAHLACEKKGDLWVKAGKSGASTCVKRTKDAGKHCVNGKQCQGECLARSNTCSPYAPLFGCNDILQDNGVRTTLCLD